MGSNTSRNRRHDEIMSDRYDELDKWLKKASDDELGRLLSRALVLMAHDRDADWDLGNPVVAVEWSYMGLIDHERMLRSNSLAAMEAEMNGGHRVVVALGDEPDTYAAYCDPHPGDEPAVLCWYGPDRMTVDAAVDDGRLHVPGVEPEVARVCR